MMVVVGVLEFTLVIEFILSARARAIMASSEIYRPVVDGGDDNVTAAAATIAVAAAVVAGENCVEDEGIKKSGKLSLLCLLYTTVSSTLSLFLLL